MKKHSEPAVYIFAIIMTIILVLVAFVIWRLVLFLYLEVGLMVWILSRGDASFWKSLLLWYPAMILDKPEWLFSKE